MPFASPKMAAMPAFKSKRCIPFKVTGLDYFGPASLKADYDTTILKRWVCLFFSLIKRNTHLEVVFDMSTTSFLNCYRKLIETRGEPIVVYSDNATRLKAANKTSTKLWNQLIVDEYVCAYYSNKSVISGKSERSCKGCKSNDNE